MNKHSTPKWIEYFFMLFSARIEVEANLDSFTFRKGHEFKKFNTFLYVSKNAERPQIISVGETPIRQDGAVKIKIFEKKETDSIYDDKYDCLAAFLMHCLKTITSKYAIVRPSIYVNGADNLEPVLNGFQNKVLIHAFGDAGAARVFINN